MEQTNKSLASVLGGTVLPLLESIKSAAGKKKVYMSDDEEDNRPASFLEKYLPKDAIPGLQKTMKV